jgi:hypothetical protein
MSQYSVQWPILVNTAVARRVAEDYLSNYCFLKRDSVP